MPALCVATIVGTSITLAHLGLSHLEALEPLRREAHAADRMQSREALYLPSATAAEISSLGYRNMLAHLLWFNTINYFGKQYRSEKNYRWFAHMCDIVSRLNPRLEYVYPFCSTLLSWEGDQPEKAIALLSRAIDTYPENWQFWYHRGFTKIYFLGDQGGGEADFVHAATLPGAHPIVKSLAAKKLVGREGPEAAIQFLAGSLRVTNDPAARSALEARLKDILLYQELGALNEALTAYRDLRREPPQELSHIMRDSPVLSRIRDRGFQDPLGGHYALSEDGMSVVSSSGTPSFSPTWNTKEERDRRIAEAKARGEL
jgi:tetratricopeptide (TPR) repeat protein